jgi:hypothetical protein
LVSRFGSVRVAVGRSKRLGLFAVVVVLLGACGGDNEAAVPRRHVVGGDLLIVMQVGEGPGALAERLIDGPDLDPFGGAAPGSASHVAFFQSSLEPVPLHHTPQGVVHFVTFTAGRENPRGGAAGSCLWWGGSASCGPRLKEPGVLGFGNLAVAYYAAGFGGEHSTEAVFATASGNTVSVLTANGYAYAEWDTEWGHPTAIDFYTDQSLLGSFAVPTED